MTPCRPPYITQGLQALPLGQHSLHDRDSLSQATQSGRAWFWGESSGLGLVLGSPRVYLPCSAMLVNSATQVVGTNVRATEVSTAAKGPCLQGREVWD